MSFKNQIIILFIFFKYISCELEEESMLRAFSCLNIITQKFKKKGEALSSSYSPHMLACFIKITYDQMKTIISNIEEGNEDLILLDDDELKKLTDFDSLKDIPEKELKKNKVILEKTMKKFEKMNKEIERMKKGNNIDEKELNSFDDDNYDDFNLDDGDLDYDDDYGDYDDEDDDYNSLKTSIRDKGFLRILFRGTKNFFKNSNIWFSFLFLIITYFLLLAMRKSFEADKEEKIIEEKEEIENEKNENKEKEKNEIKNDNKENENLQKEKEKIQKE